MPGPYRSILKPYRAQIAALRNTDPPTPYEEIAAILLKDHGIKIRASSIWNFVKAREEGKEPRKVVKLAEERPHSTSQPARSGPEAQPEVDARKEEETDGDVHDQAMDVIALKQKQAQPERNKIVKPTNL